MTNVLLLYEMFIPSVRLCAFEQLNYLMENDQIHLEHCLAKNVTKRMCMKCDIVIFVRSASILEERLAIQFKNYGKLMIYSLDDDLLNVVDGLFSSEYYGRSDVRDRIKHIMQLCDILVTPSPVLANKYNSLFRKVVIIEEPCLNHTDQRTHNIDSIVKIGFAGSIDRTGDIDEILTEVIKSLIQKYNTKISFEFMGARPKIVDEYNLKHYPYEQNYDMYKDKIANVDWDIGLAPMPDTKFHNCKHYNKYIEYSSSSIVGIYSNVEPYKRIIVNMKNGLLCDNIVQDWIDSISWLVDHKEERDAMIDFNRKKMEEEFKISIITENLIQELPELIEFKAYKCNKFPLLQMKIVMLIYRTLHYIQRNGWKSPMLIIKKVTKVIKI